MRRALILALFSVLSMSSTANAAAILLNTDPFAGSTALTTPGRQIVGGEPFINFSIASDVFEIDRAIYSAFGVGDQVLFVNALAASLPVGGVNVIVLQSFDNDNNPATPFAAGTAADLIAAQLTTPGAGFFIYFNQGLDLPRLVFSTDLNDPTADLKILARMTNLTAQPGRDAIPTFTQGNFAMVGQPQRLPEPSTLLLMLTAIFGAGVLRARRWRT